jgi:trans-aconitate methyltransferase
MYEWDAKDYHKSSSEQQKWARELIAKLNLKGSEKVLDIGCGDGKITAELAGRLPEGSVLGIDNSAEMIDFAWKTYPPENYPNLAFRVADARQLDFSGEFDVVVSFACLHWLIDHRPVLERIKKSLKPAGRILLQFGGKGNAGAILEAIEKVTASKKWYTYLTGMSFPWGFYGPDEYRNWLEHTGFEVKRVELIPKDALHKGNEGLAGYIRTTAGLPYAQRLPEDMRQEFINEVVERYAEVHPPDSEGFIHLLMMRLEVEAVKKPAHQSQTF